MNLSVIAQLIVAISVVIVCGYFVSIISWKNLNNMVWAIWRKRLLPKIVLATLLVAEFGILL
jgi:hypothetical protein